MENDCAFNEYGKVSCSAYIGKNKTFTNLKVHTLLTLLY